jgi:long-chain acyl-CoA synthetase
MDRLIKKAGIGEIDCKQKYVAIKIHFGEPGNLAFLRPNFAKENVIPYLDNESLVKLPEIMELIHTEITERVNRKTGFRGFEMIFRSAVLSKPFEPGVELSGKQDYKRHVITEMYKKEIQALFAD